MNETTGTATVDRTVEIAETWAALGREYHPLGRALVLKVDAPSEKTESGLLWLPPGTKASYASKLGHNRLLRCTVLSAGPESSVKVGERVCCNLLPFVRFERMKDGADIGSLLEEDLFGYIEEE